MPIYKKMYAFCSTCDESQVAKVRSIKWFRSFVPAIKFLGITFRKSTPSHVVRDGKMSIVRCIYCDCATIYRDPALAAQWHNEL